MHNIVCDENIPLWFVKKLRSLGYDVLYITEHNYGISDPEVLRITLDHKAILITRDRDFGELVFFLGVEVKNISILYIRADLEKIDMVIFGLLKDITKKGDFIVVGPHTIRKKQL